MWSVLRITLHRRIQQRIQSLGFICRLVGKLLRDGRGSSPLCMTRFDLRLFSSGNDNGCIGSSFGRSLILFCFNLDFFPWSTDGSWSVFAVCFGVSIINPFPEAWSKICAVAAAFIVGNLLEMFLINFILRCLRTSSPPVSQILPMSVSPSFFSCLVKLVYITIEKEIAMMEVDATYLPSTVY